MTPSGVCGISSMPSIWTESVGIRTSSLRIDVSMFYSSRICGTVLSAWGLIGVIPAGAIGGTGRAADSPSLRLTDFLQQLFHFFIAGLRELLIPQAYRMERIGRAITDHLVRLLAHLA